MLFRSNTHFQFLCPKCQEALQATFQKSVLKWSFFSSRSYIMNASGASLVHICGLFLCVPQFLLWGQHEEDLTLTPPTLTQELPEGKPLPT